MGFGIGIYDNSFGNISTVLNLLLKTTKNKVQKKYDKTYQIK